MDALYRSVGGQKCRRFMGSSSAYMTSSGKRYRVIYRRPDHRQTQKRGFKTKLDAELFLAKT